MKKQRIALFFMFMSCCAATLHAQPRLPDDTFRAAYWWTKAPEQTDGQLRALKTYGLNSALIKDGSFRVREARLLGWANSAAQHGIAFFHVLNFAGKEESKELQGKFRPFVNAQGKLLAATPCPCDETYWDNSIRERFARIAHLAQSKAIAGILFDTEMYGGNFRIYRDPCLCDVCWRRFCEIQTSNLRDTLPNQRMKILQERHLLEEYTREQEARLQKILRKIEERIHRIAPHVSLGFLFYRDNWFYRGLMRGLGTEEVPVLVFSESSYIRGYTPDVEEERASIQAASAQRSQSIARYIPGLWLGRFFPQDIATQLYQLASHSDGYWLFSADSLWRAQNQGAYTLHGTHQEHWTAFKQANDALLSKSSHHAGLLPAPWPSSFYESARKRLFTPGSLQKFFARFLFDAENTPLVMKSDDKTTTYSPITYRGATLFHCLYDGSGEIRITHVPVAKYSDSTSYKLFNSRGELVQEGSLDKQRRTAKIVLTETMRGLLSLLTESGMNATRVEFESIPYVIEASTTFPLATMNSAHAYAYVVAPDQSRLTLRAFCSQGEAAYLEIESSDQPRRRQIEVKGFTEANIPLSSERGAETAASLQTLSVLPVTLDTFEDVRFYFYNQEYPYLVP